MLSGSLTSVVCLCMNSGAGEILTGRHGRSRLPFSER